MASFLARALALPAAGGDHFTDDAGTAHEDAHQPHRRGRHHRPAARPTRFCPNGIVNRQQMAAFLYRALAP